MSEQPEWLDESKGDCVRFTLVLDTVVAYLADDEATWIWQVNDQASGDLLADGQLRCDLPTAKLAVEALARVLAEVPHVDQCPDCAGNGVVSIGLAQEAECRSCGGTGHGRED